LSEARQQAEEVAHELVNKFWSIPYDDDLVKLIAEAIAAEVQRSNSERDEAIALVRKYLGREPKNFAWIDKLAHEFLERAR